MLRLKRVKKRTCYVCRLGTLLSATQPLPSASRGRCSTGEKQWTLVLQRPYIRCNTSIITRYCTKAISSALIYTRTVQAMPPLLSASRVRRGWRSSAGWAARWAGPRWAGRCRRRGRSGHAQQPSLESGGYPMECSFNSDGSPSGFHWIRTDFTHAQRGTWSDTPGVQVPRNGGHARPPAGRPADARRAAAGRRRPPAPVRVVRGVCRSRKAVA